MSELSLQEALQIAATAAMGNSSHLVAPAASARRGSGGGGGTSAGGGSEHGSPTLDRTPTVEVLVSAARLSQLPPGPSVVPALLPPDSMASPFDSVLPACAQPVVAAPLLERVTPTLANWQPPPPLTQPLRRVTHEQVEEVRFSFGGSHTGPPEEEQQQQQQQQEQQQQEQPQQEQQQQQQQQQEQQQQEQPQQEQQEQQQQQQQPGSRQGLPPMHPLVHPPSPQPQFPQQAPPAAVRRSEDVPAGWRLEDWGVPAYGRAAQGPVAAWQNSSFYSSAGSHVPSGERSLLCAARPTSLLLFPPWLAGWLATVLAGLRTAFLTCWLACLLADLLAGWPADSQFPGLPPGPWPARMAAAEGHPTRRCTAPRPAPHTPLRSTSRAPDTRAPPPTPRLQCLPRPPCMTLQRWWTKPPQAPPRFPPQSPPWRG